MARQIGWALAALIVTGSVVGAADGVRGQTETGSPPQQKPNQQDNRRDAGHRGPWIWWKDKGAVGELKLTPEQSARIDEIFKKSMERARPLREEVQQLEVALDKTIRAATTDVREFAQQVDLIESKRAELNKMRTVMLYRMRLVLNADQNARFQAMVDRWEAERRKQDSDRRR